MAIDSKHYPMPVNQVMGWYKSKLKLVRNKYPDVNGVAHPKVRAFALGFQQVGTGTKTAKPLRDGYGPLKAWLDAEGIE